jgi:hypothetical protein
VSLMSRNRSQPQFTGVRGQAMQVANQAIPLAQSAGGIIRDSANDAVVWATPRLNDLRAWAAPQIEQAGFAVRDTIAPRISDALVQTARKVDVPKQHRRRWPRLLVGTLLLAAAASAATAISRLRQEADAGYTPSTSPVGGSSGSTLTDLAEHRDGDGSKPADSEIGDFSS